MESELNSPASEPWDSPPSSPVQIIQSGGSPRRKVLVPALLFLLTCFTTLVAGFLFHVQWVSQSDEELFRRISTALSEPLQLLDGVPFAATILLILLAHEMGHYLTCRYYGINATLPYVIPAPPLIVPFGTFGAVIRIRSLFRDRKQLFDVGIAGPLAGFVIIVPALVVGIVYSNEYAHLDDLESVIVFGEPLLFQLAAKVFFEGDTFYMNLHPVGWAAWFGMLATSLNLLPVGQLDGGHIVYAVLGEKAHRLVSYCTFGGLILLGTLSWPMLGYMLFAVILLFLRFRHPRPYFDVPGVGPERFRLALVALLVFALTFIPIPVQLVENTGTL